MRSRLAIFLLALSLLSQGLAVVNLGVRASAPSDLMHHVLHWLGEAHHHHDDGSWQVDESAASSQHVAGDHLSHPVGLCHTGETLAAVMGGSVPSHTPSLGLPQPHLDGLLRPPRRV